MTLREVYKLLGREYDETNVRIYQYMDDLSDDIVVFDNILDDVFATPDKLLDVKVKWFTCYPTAEWLEVHLEA